MLRNMAIRHRITAAYVILALVLCAVFSSAVLVTFKTVERELIEKRLGLEFDRFLERKRQGRAAELPVGVQFLQAATIPVPILNLPAGLHEVTIGEQSFHVLVRMVAGERLVLVEDTSQFEQIEATRLMALAAAIVACLLLALFLGRITSSRVIAPLKDLADAVQLGIAPQAFPSLNSTDEIGVLARALATRAANLDQFLVRERLFTGDVSHELRTPLTIILGAAELLVANLKDRPKLEPVAERIRRVTVDTTERVAALLLLSRSPEVLDTRLTALSPLIRQELERCAPLLNDRPVTTRLDVKDEVWVLARPELVSIAIGNLLRNACQYTERGTVTVRLETNRIVIEDSGVGLPESVRSRLFERFVRGHNESITGSGLGLSIVKRVVEHLGWDIQLEDSPGGGSHFTLLIQAS